MEADRLAQLLVKSEADEPLTEEDVAFCKKLRKAARQKVTKAHSYTVAGNHGLYADVITIQSCVNNTELLTSIDLLIEPDAQSEEYLQKLCYIRKRLQEDVAITTDEQARRDHEQKLKKAEIDRQQLLTQLEQLKLANEQQAAAQKEALHQAQLAVQRAHLDAASKSPPPVNVSPVHHRGTKNELPKFDGVPSHYQQWEALFEELIEKNVNYLDADKFLIYKERIGEKGISLIGCVKPTKQGLEAAKKRVRSFFSDPSRVRDNVYSRVSAMKDISFKTASHHLRESIAILEEGLEALQAANSGDTYINSTYFELMMSKIPQQMVEQYLQQLETAETADSLLQYIKDRVDVLIRAQELHSRTATRSTPTKPRASTVASVSTNPSPANRPTTPRTGQVQSPRANQSRGCRLCGLPHRTIFCTSFDDQRRRDIATQKNLCTVCLRSDHRTADCQSTYTCPCGERHSKVLCNRNGQPASSASSPRNSGTTGQTTPMQVTNTAQTQANVFVTNSVSPSHPVNNNTAALKYADPTHLVSYYQTVMVRVNGEPTRILLDSAAGRSIIADDYARKLGLKNYSSQRLDVGGISGHRFTTSTRLVTATLTPIDESNTTLDVVLSTVKHLPLRFPALSSDHRKQLLDAGYCVADTDDCERYPVRMILGLEDYGAIWAGTEIPFNDLYLRKSIFGWIAFGVTQREYADAATYVNIVSTNYDIQPKQLADKQPMNKVELEYLQEFIANHVHYRNGRYSVGLPWIQPIQMGDNRRLAYKRFQRLLNDLRSRGLFQQYREALDDMTAKFAERAPSKSGPNMYHLPHHCVLRLDKSTTQTRIVFDASSKDGDKRSLNANLFKGLNTWSSLNTLLKFRFGQSAVIADIEKAFMTIGIEHEDRDALRFWWLDDHDQPVVYRFTAVPFGTSASPFLLFAVLHHHFERHSTEFADVVSLIRTRMYVDDVLLSLQSTAPEQLNLIRDRCIELFSRANMNLRKWRSNIAELDAQWSPGASEIVKVLGHLWNVRTDTLSLAINTERLLPKVLTKREFTSFAASLYDPLGFISPFVIKLRLFLRKLWQLDVKWDDALPGEHLEEGLQLMNDSVCVHDVALPRNVLPPDDSPTTLLVYCDASKVALGAVAYCSSETGAKLLMSKAKLAREATIPELELDALVLAAQLTNSLAALHQFDNVIVCSDSLLNLQRLLKHPNTQRPSVSLRVNQVKKLASASFRHVKSADNIADLISRGLSLTELINKSDWWNAPPLPSSTPFEHELSAQVMSIFTIPTNGCSCTLFPNYGKAINVYRRVARFLMTATRYQSFSEYDLALLLLIKAVQRNHFDSEIDDINTGGPVDRCSVLRNFSCYLDEHRVLRLRTRLLSGTVLTDEQVCPILLPAQCHMTRLIVIQEHKRALHAGVDRTITSVRSRFYVPGIKRLAKSIVKSCLLCKIKRAESLDASHGMVPRFRYDALNPPFTNTGLDIFGPLKVTMTTKGKRYGLIFTCATTRAVHLEVIANMTAEEVFQAMRRFIARRGVPQLIYSDNGTQLVSVKKHLLKMMEGVSRANPAAELRIKWLHLTVSSPWRGGFYERLIRTIKENLIAISFKRVINDAELVTAFVEIEAHLNSRPLFTYNGEVITPAHFYRGTSLMQLPSIGNNIAASLDSRESIVDTYIRSRRSVNSVWRRWCENYLLELRSFHQNVNTPNSSNRYQVGDVVLLKSTTSPELWPLGVIEQLHPSPDGVLRTVDVSTTERKNKVIKKRDVRTLIPLECAYDRPPPPTDPDASADE